MIGVALPPIDAGIVLAGPSRYNGLPDPLNSRLPLKAVGLMIGYAAGTTFALTAPSLPGSPKAGNFASASRTVGGSSSVVGTGRTGTPPRMPIRNILSRDCGTP